MVAKNYGSVEGEATIIDKKYAPTDNLLSLSGEPVDYALVKTFNGAKFWNYLKAHEDDYWNIFHTGYLANLQVNKTGGDNYNVEFSGFSGTYLKINGETTFDAFTLALHAGIGVDPTGLPDVTTDAITIYPSYGIAATSLNKLYGSVNGESKLIFQRIRRLGPPTRPEFGIVYYKIHISDPDSAIRSVELQSQAEFDSLRSTTMLIHPSWTATVGERQVTVSNDSYNVIVGIKIGSEITEIKNFFLYNCIALSMPIVIPDNVTTIGTDFLNKCINYNLPITIPDSVTSIGSSFLYRCTSFDQSLTLPSSLTSIGENFMALLQDMTGTVNIGSLPATTIVDDQGGAIGSFCAENNICAAYMTGVSIAGASRSEWLAKFPNSVSNPKRKLLDAGY